MRLKNKKINQSKLETIYEEDYQIKQKNENDDIIVAYLHKSHVNNTKIDLWSGKIVFKMVLKTMDKSDRFNTTNAFLKLVNEKRKTCLKNVINENYKDKKVLKEIYLAIHDFWIKEFIQALDIIQMSDRRELIDAKVYKFYNYKIIIKKMDESPEQALIDYLGLCWIYYVEKNIVSNCESDIIVSNNGFRMFMHIVIGIEFIEEFKKITSSIEDAPKIDITDIRVISKEFDTLLFPTISALVKFPQEFIEHYATWSRVPY